MNTERAQLQGSLSAALNDRDIVTAERDSAMQEVAFVRRRLDELAGQLHGAHTSNGNQVHGHQMHGHHAPNGDNRVSSVLASVGKFSFMLLKVVKTVANE